MKLLTFIKLMANGQSSLMFKLLKMRNEFYRACFISTPISQRIYERFINGKSRFEHLCEKLNVVSNREGLLAWLELGVSLGELKRVGNAYQIRHERRLYMKGEFMLKRILGILLLVFCVAPLHQVLAASDPNDCQGCKDPALFSRMPGFHISSYEELDFDRVEFPVGLGKNQAVEGRYFYIDYYANEGIEIPSGLQISRNYVNAAKAIGGEKVYEFEDGGTQYVTLKVVKNGAEVWAMVAGASNGMYKVKIIEKQMMSQVVVANAESLAGNINETGKAAIYGIYFDTGKAAIKPESEPALSEIVKLLKANSTLKLYVVGHTDNVGGFDYNIKLSQSRAAAVVDALVKKSGIAASRLTPFGAGPTAPVASNKNEEGRAKNRRVELVAQ